MIRLRLTLIWRAFGVLWMAAFGYLPEISHYPDIVAVGVPPCRGCKRCKPYVHASENLRTTMCGRRCDAWLCGTEHWRDVSHKDACPLCFEITTTN